MQKPESSILYDLHVSTRLNIFVWLCFLEIFCFNNGDLKLDEQSQLISHLKDEMVAKDGIFSTLSFPAHI